MDKEYRVSDKFNDHGYQIIKVNNNDQKIIKLFDTAKTEYIKEKVEKLEEQIKEQIVEYYQLVEYYQSSDENKRSIR